MPAPTDAHKRSFDAAASALGRGDWRNAYELAAQLIPQLPSNASLHFIAGAAALELQQAPVAIEWLSRAADLDPSRADVAAQLARALLAMHMRADATAAADRAFALGPTDPMTLDVLGVVYSRLDAHAKAAQVFGRLVDAHPRQAGYRFNLATSLVFAGDAVAAERALEQCLALDPRFWKAWPALSQLRTQTPADNHVERLQAALTLASTSEPQHPDAATFLHMALAKELEDLEQYPRAFDHLVQGKGIARRARQYAISRDEPMFEAIVREFAGPAEMAAGHSSREPIFVFGMPRSGTTLVERILASHPQVHAAGELENFAVALKRASGSRTPAMLDADTVARARDVDWATLGADYLAGTRPGTGNTPFFVDKLPQNFLYAGYIANALPMAKMICVRRDPMDTCLGNFRQLFPLASRYYDYSLDLLDTGRYYLLFDRLMAHWEQVLPGRILSIRYETLVDQQEAVTRQLLDACALPWDEACLRFEQNTAPVATASTLQVRAPMHRASIGRWKRYEHQLEPLRQLLEDAGIAIAD